MAGVYVSGTYTCWFQVEIKIKMQMELFWWINRLIAAAVEV
jgi:hypothetical protein